MQSEGLPEVIDSLSAEIGVCRMGSMASESLRAVGIDASPHPGNQVERTNSSVRRARHAPLAPWGVLCRHSPGIGCKQKWLLHRLHGWRCSGAPGLGPQIPIFSEPKGSKRCPSSKNRRETRSTRGPACIRNKRNAKSSTTALNVAEASLCHSVVAHADVKEIL